MFYFVLQLILGMFLTWKFWLVLSNVYIDALAKIGDKNRDVTSLTSIYMCINISLQTYLRCL